MNDRFECHRLKEGESFPLIGGQISFGPSVRRYGRQTGANDYIFSFRIYSQHEMEEQLDPHEFAERKKARARFKTARLFVGFPCAFFVDADDHV